MNGYRKTKKGESRKEASANGKGVDGPPEQVDGPNATSSTGTIDGPTEKDGGRQAEGDNAPDLAEEEAKELKDYQAKIRKETPNSRAVAILHTLELLRNDLNGEDFDEELLQILSRIAHLAEEMKGLNKKNDDQHDS